MRCTHCGQKLVAGLPACTRCGTDLTAHARHKRLLHTVIFFVVAAAFAALLIYVVLRWHDAQIFM